MDNYIELEFVSETFIEYRNIISTIYTQDINQWVILKRKNLKNYLNMLNVQW
jgi:hypothetical protein